MTGRVGTTLCALAVLGEAVAAAPGDLRVTPGELVVERPTLINLGFEWHIDGDANRNAQVQVSFRKQGETPWRDGLPLARLHGEQVVQRNVFNLVVPNMFAGSLLDLEPGTAYEARFVLTDPDGVAGPAADATKVVTVRTRPEPSPAAGGAVYHVYPRSGRARRSSRPSKGSCAPTTTTAAPVTRPRRASAGQAGRHGAGARRGLCVSLRVLRQQHHGQRDHHLRGHLLPDRRRHR